MTSISIKIQANQTKLSSEAMTIYGVSSSDKGPVLVGNAANDTALKAINLKSLQVTGKAENTTRVASNAQVIGLVGVGESIDTHSKAREIGGAIGRSFADHKTLLIDIPLATKEIALALLEGVAIVQYEYDKYKSASKSTSALKQVLLVSKLNITKAELDRIKTVVSILDATRDLVNAPANDLYPSKLAEIVKSQGKIPGVKVEIWDEKKLAKEKCRGILAVGQGSVRPPRLVKITYTPANPRGHLALVGKGITFDTGGLSLKDKLGILGMKYDMAGAATVAQAAFAIARLKLPIRVTAFMCIAENMPSGSATRPTDVVTFRNGKTVEITNTDAEGRIVLADGLILASESKPDLIVDVATLTGAVRVALGNRYTGLMGDDNAVALVQDASKDSGELVWHMPLPEELLDLIKSDIADFMNSKIGNPTGGMLVGGLFLREFVGTKKNSKERLNWAHLDFASSANNDLGPYGYTVKGATGAMVRTLISLAEQLATKNNK